MFKAENYAEIFNQIEDDPRKFPHIGISVLRDLNLLSFDRFQNANLEKKQTLLELLFEIGKGDLSIGRIFEGHINALQLLARFGNQRQLKEYSDYANKGHLFGIWNTEENKDRLKIVDKNNELLLKGAKIYCSGALNIHFPIVTAYSAKGPQMLLLPLENNLKLTRDWSLWNPIGMRASVSCKLDFSGIKITKEQFLGNPNDYYKEPDFSWGAVRFSAVQLGGAQSIMEIVLQALVSLDRAFDPYQKMRIAKMAILMKTAKLWLSEAELMESEIDKVYTTKAKINFANMMRSLSLSICEEIISIAEKALGMQAIMKGHPLERKIRDLRVYLKQAGPDAALANVGHYMAEKEKEECQKQDIQQSKF